MARRTTITLRESDFEALESLKKALDIPTSQALALSVRVAEMIRKNQAENGRTILQDKYGNPKEAVFLGLTNNS